jgi:acyl-CoA thioesterase
MIFGRGTTYRANHFIDGWAADSLDHTVACIGFCRLFKLKDWRLFQSTPVNSLFSREKSNNDVHLISLPGRLVQLTATGLAQRP